MAGFWIKWECGLTKKREIAIIARKLQCDRRQAAAMCMEFWEWASEQSTDGVLAGMALHDVSEVLGIKGFAEAMADAGWLTEGESGLQVPNWDRHNSKPAKLRLQSSERKRRERERRQTCHGASVTHVTVTP